MKVSVVFLITSSLLIAAASEVAVVKHQHDEDHDHDEEHHDEEPFHHLTEILGSENEQIDDAALSKLLDGLKKNFNCDVAEPCNQCLTVETLKQSFSNNSLPYTEDTFFEAAAHIVQVLQHNECNVTEENVTIADMNPICRNQLETIVREVETRYKGTNSNECFNQYTLIGESCTNDTHDVIYNLLVQLYEGNCILPSPVEVENDMFDDHLFVSGDVVTEAAYFILLDGLNIGGETSEGHSDEAHNHAEHRRKKRETDEHAHHDHGDHAHELEGHHDTCWSAGQLKAIFGFQDNITRNQLLEMCPVFLQQVISRACQPSVQINPTSSPFLYTNAMKYGYGTVSVLVISLLALVGMFFFPVLHTPQFRLIMQFFIALGVATMSGDALLHIIPEITGLHAHDESDGGHDHAHEGIPAYVWKMLAVVGGIWIFYLFENGLKLLSKDGPVHSHNHMHGSVQYKDRAAKSEDDVCVTKFSDIKESGDDDAIKTAKNINDQNEPQIYIDDGKKRYFWGITATGIMIFFGDILHNFGDGIAIGAAFSSSWTQGVGTSLAIIFHELPHEFGDFAIYLNNGLSKWRAIALNFIAACCCFIGLYIGIAVSEDEEVRVWLLSFVAGMFLYISLVNVLHEMVAEISIHPKLQFLLQNLGLLLGWVIMLLLSIYEEQLVASIHG